MNVTFCGHSDTPYAEDIIQWLNKVVEDLIKQGADTFYLGGYGNFDCMAAAAVWACKQRYPHIRAVLVIPYLDKSVDISGYDYSIYPPLENVPRKYAIAHRNRWMVDNSSIMVAYVRYGWGGAAKTLERAYKKGLHIIRWQFER